MHFILTEQTLMTQVQGNLVKVSAGWEEQAIATNTSSQQTKASQKL